MSDPVAARSVPAAAERGGQENILVIKLGAFGNIVLSMAAFAAIRRHHAGAHISVLTGRAYAGWLRSFPYFDTVLEDPRPAWWDRPARRRLQNMLVAGSFSRVYDLQTSVRSSGYFALFPAKRRPAWSGIAYGCSLPDRDPNRNRLHDAVRIKGQLRQAGIADYPLADMSWCRGDAARFQLPADIALLVPGSSPNRLIKRWPAASYEALAQILRAQGIAPVVLGSAAERDLAASIPSAVDLAGQTSFGDLADLARSARFAVGNDTGPMHLLATAGCMTLTLFSADSDPVLCAPVGPVARVLQRPRLADLSVAEVVAQLPLAPPASTPATGTFSAGVSA